MDRQGNLYVADTGNNRVREYDGPLPLLEFLLPISLRLGCAHLGGLVDGQGKSPQRAHQPPVAYAALSGSRDLLRASRCGA